MEIQHTYSIKLTWIHWLHSQCLVEWHVITSMAATNILQKTITYHVKLSWLPWTYLRLEKLLLTLDAQNATNSGILEGLANPPPQLKVKKVHYLKCKYVYVNVWTLLGHLSTFLNTPLITGHKCYRNTVTLCGYVCACSDWLYIWMIYYKHHTWTVWCHCGQHLCDS